MEIGTSAKRVQETIERLPGVGSISVKIIHGIDMIDYSITFVENIAPVSVVIISGATLDDDSFRVCAKSTSSCVEGTLSHGCESPMTTTGTIPTQTFEVELNNAATNYSEFRNIISNLVQSSATYGGFGVRVAAVNSRGVENACQAVFNKLMNIPDSPSMVELVRDPSSTSALILYFIADSYPEETYAFICH